MTKQFLSDKFDTSQVSNLSLFLSHDSLTIMAKDQNDAVIGSQLFHYSNTEELGKVVDECKLFHSGATKAKIFVHNEHFSLVPGLVFDPYSKEKYLNFATDLLTESESITFSDSLDSNNLHVVGALENKIHSIFSNSIPEIQISHGSIIFLSYLLNTRQEFIDQEIFIDIKPNNVYLAAFASNELQLFNRFEVNNEEELLKYIFVVFHQLNFTRNYCKVNIFGDLSIFNSSRENLEEYFRHVIEVAPKTNINYLPGAETIKETKDLDAYWTIY